MKDGDINRMINHDSSQKQKDTKLVAFDGDLTEDVLRASFRWSLQRRRNFQMTILLMDTNPYTCWPAEKFTTSTHVARVCAKVSLNQFFADFTGKNGLRDWDWIPFLKNDISFRPSKKTTTASGAPPLSRSLRIAMWKLSIGGGDGGIDNSFLGAISCRNAGGIPTDILGPKDGGWKQ